MFEIYVYSHLLLKSQPNKKNAQFLLEKYYDPEANIYQLTRYAFGRNRSLQTAIVDLVDRNILESQKDGTFAFHPSRYRYSPDEQNPLIQNLLKMKKLI